MSVKLSTLKKAVTHENKSSIQPVTKLFEQATHIVFDAVVVELLDKLGVTEVDMRNRHNLLE